MKKIICWFSGGVTSAVACKIAINIYGKENCRVIMIDTHNESDDTYRFKKDCEIWYEVEIETISAIPDKYSSIQDVWLRYKTLNSATGAICSTDLKRLVRERWQKENEFSYQVFGFEFDKKEFNRALSMKINYGNVVNPIFPLLLFGYDKQDCFDIITKNGIEVPEMYKLGFGNNNCFKTGCIQGGIGYWKKIQREFPDKFQKMAEIEHYLTELAGHQVTMLKDQSIEGKGKKELDKRGNLVFLIKHPDYGNKCLDDMKDRDVEPIFECNGLCGINDLNNKNKTENEINYQ